MAKKKPKFYVVWKGRNVGIFDTWDDCKAQVFGFEGAQYKSFDSREEALTAFQSGYHASIKSPKSIKTSTAKISRTAIVPSSISVDAACSGNPGMMEYRGVMTDTGKEIFHLGPLRDGTNNIGEFLALVHVLALLKQKGREDIPIYSDSKIAIGWIKKGKANTKLEHTGHNEPIFQLIQRAERWLANNSFANPILKWETDSWGEIPADFGRK
ncbi:MAG TPA: ribonuclease H family protein [Saprospiraceae bacterium]|nr:ribonuclease H family protein [Saprospiraceae bacterium]HNS79636.1 ribonuclease H family protein [Syntrophorhabdus sp.]MBX7180431.1 ribonuclease H family protein [Saprospiraceae bacterium]MCB0591630.1 ribonuclease H family protein [Saprospiraceae bacterium]MCC7150022.1 ribonuclease H family protein [Saprospiraceae bacterium]